MVDLKVVDFIKTSLSQNQTKELIYKELLAQGWSIENIQEGFNLTVRSQEKEDTQKRTIRIILTIGTILIGAGIFSFIAANWQEMSKLTKIIIIVTSMLTAYASGWHLKEKLNYHKTGGMLLLLGSIIYGAGIFLLGQIFNIRANWPDGFILWMLGTIAMAFAVESYQSFSLAIILGIVVIFGHPFIIFSNLDNGFLLSSSLLLALSTVVTFVSGISIRKKMDPKLKEIY